MSLLSSGPAIILCLILAACGLYKPDYKPYDYVPVDGGSSGGGGNGSEDCPEGTQLTSYMNHIAAAVNTTCSSVGCHAGISKMLLVANEDNTNREKILEYSKGDAALLRGFLHSTSHNGGNMASTLSAEAINTWLATEAKCK